MTVARIPGWLRLWLHPDPSDLGGADAYRAALARRAVHPDLVAEDEGGHEEGEALVVVVVHVAEEQMRLKRHLLQQRIAQRADAGAARFSGR